jgi:AcrR family transcriptional regulator
MEPRPRRTASPDVRKKQITQAARTCFVHDGFASTKVADIARSAGISVGLIYRHFPNKTALMTAIVAEEAHRQFDELVSPIQQLSDGVRLTADALIDGLRHGLRDRDRVLLMLEVTTAMMRDDDLRQAALAIQIEQSRAVAQRLVTAMGSEIGEQELGRRLQVLAGLATGFAIQIAVAPNTEAEVTRLFEESASAILTSP